MARGGCGSEAHPLAARPISGVLTQEFGEHPPLVSKPLFQIGSEIFGTKIQTSIGVCDAHAAARIRTEDLVVTWGSKMKNTPKQNPCTTCLDN